MQFVVWMAGVALWPFDERKSYTSVLQPKTDAKYNISLSRLQEPYHLMAAVASRNCHTQKFCALGSIDVCFCALCAL